MTAAEVKQALTNLADKKKSLVLQRFFKTKPGEYGEGDVFIGVTVPKQRQVAKKYKKLPLSEIEVLLGSPVHEHRLTGLLILVSQFHQADAASRREIYDFYLAHTDAINNWDLVDLSAPKIVGEYLLEHPRDKEVLYHLALSKNLWERRIAILATYAFIKRKMYTDTTKLASMLIDDTHDLIHKAVGWMLREVGKMDQSTEENFLDQHSQNMPRTMLRYAIEKFDPKRRQHYLGKKKPKA